MLKDCHCMQKTENDCAVACIKSIFKFYRINVNSDYISLKVKQNNLGTNMIDIVKFFQEIECSPRLFKVTGKNVLEKISNKDLKTPCIALVGKQNSVNHFIVILKITSSRIFISDPSSNQIEQVEKHFLDKILYLLDFTIPKNKQVLINKLQIDDELSIFRIILNGEKKKLLVIFLMTIVATIVGVLSSVVNGIIFDKLYPLGVDGILQMNVFIGLIFFIMLINEILIFIKNIICIELSTSLEYKIVERFFLKILFKRYKLANKNVIGKYVSTLNDSLIFSEFMSNSFITLVFNGLIVIFSTMAILIIDLTIGGIIIFTIMIVLCVAVKFHETYYFLNKKVQVKNEEFSTEVIEILENLEEIKYLSAESYHLSAIRDKVKKYLDSAKKISVYTSRNMSLITILFLISSTWILLYLSNKVMNSYLTIGAVYIVISLSTSVFLNVTQLVNAQNIFERFYIMINRLKELLSDEIYEINNKIIISNKIRSIKLQNYSLTIGEKVLLKDIFLSINKSENRNIVIQGESGSGKTTLMKSIIGTAGQHRGNIMINEVNINEVSDSEIRKKIIYLSNSVKLVNGSMWENLTLGSKLDEKFIKEVANDFQVARINNNKCLKTEFNVINLSLGEKQRINIARAVLKKPEVLILDEALSNIDVVNRRKILNNLNFLNILIFYVSHDKLELDNPVIYEISDYNLFKSNYLKEEK